MFLFDRIDSKLAVSLLQATSFSIPSPVLIVDSVLMASNVAWEGWNVWVLEIMLRLSLLAGSGLVEVSSG